MGGCCGAMKTGQKSLPDKKKSTEANQEKSNGKEPPKQANDTAKKTASVGSKEDLPKDNELHQEELVTAPHKVSVNAALPTLDQGKDAVESVHVEERHVMDMETAVAPYDSLVSGEQNEVTGGVTSTEPEVLLPYQIPVQHVITEESKDEVKLRVDESPLNAAFPGDIQLSITENVQAVPIEAHLGSASVSGHIDTQAALESEGVVSGELPAIADTLTAEVIGIMEKTPYSFEANQEVSAEVDIEEPVVKAGITTLEALIPEEPNVPILSLREDEPLIPAEPPLICVCPMPPPPEPEPDAHIAICPPGPVDLEVESDIAICPPGVTVPEPIPDAHIAVCPPAVTVPEPDAHIAVCPGVTIPEPDAHIAICPPKVTVPEPILDANIAICPPEVAVPEPIPDAHIAICPPAVTVPESDAHIAICPPGPVDLEVESDIAICPPAVSVQEPDAHIAVCPPEFTVPAPIPDAHIAVCPPEVSVPEPVPDAHIAVCPPEVSVPEPVPDAHIAVCPPAVTVPEPIPDANIEVCSGFTASEPIPCAPVEINIPDPVLKVELDSTKGELIAVCPPVTEAIVEPEAVKEGVMNQESVHDQASFPPPPTEEEQASFNLDLDPSIAVCPPGPVSPQEPLPVPAEEEQASFQPGEPLMEAVKVQETELIPDVEPTSHALVDDSATQKPEAELTIPGVSVDSTNIDSLLESFEVVDVPVEKSEQAQVGESAPRVEPVLLEEKNQGDEQSGTPSVPEPVESEHGISSEAESCEAAVLPPKTVELPEPVESVETSEPITSSDVAACRREILEVEAIDPPKLVEFTEEKSASEDTIQHLEDVVPPVPQDGTEQISEVDKPPVVIEESAPVVAEVAQQQEETSKEVKEEGAVGGASSEPSVEVNKSQEGEHLPSEEGVHHEEQKEHEEVLQEHQSESYQEQKLDESTAYQEQKLEETDPHQEQHETEQPAEQVAETLGASGATQSSDTIPVLEQVSEQAQQSRDIWWKEAGESRDAEEIPVLETVGEQTRQARDEWWNGSTEPKQEESTSDTVVADSTTQPESVEQSSSLDDPSAVPSSQVQPTVTEDALSKTIEAETTVSDLVPDVTPPEPLSSAAASQETTHLPVESPLSTDGSTSSGSSSTIPTENGGDATPQSSTPESALSPEGTEPVAAATTKEPIYTQA